MENRGGRAVKKLAIFCVGAMTLLGGARADAGGHWSVGIGIGLPAYRPYYPYYGGPYYAPYYGGYYRPYPAYVAPAPEILQPAPMVQQVPVVQPSYSASAP